MCLQFPKRQSTPEILIFQDKYPCFTPIIDRAVAESSRQKSLDWLRLRHLSHTQTLFICHNDE